MIQQSNDVFLFESPSSSTESDNYSENCTTMETVTNLFSNLLKTPEQINTNSKSSGASNMAHNVVSMNERNFNDESINDRSNSNSSSVLKEFSDNNLKSDMSNVPCEQERISEDAKPLSLAASSETLILDRNKNFSTPLNSKIPVKNVRSDPSDFSGSDKKIVQNTGLKMVNSRSLKRICSNSKIPVRETKKNNAETFSQDSYSRKYFEPTNTLRANYNNDQITYQKRTRRTGNKYDHVKSKLAAYINKPPKTESIQFYSTCNIKNNVKCVRNQNQMKNNTSPLYASHSNNIRRSDNNSRSSLDIHTYDYKMPLSNLCNSDSNKSEDIPSNYRRAWEHFELAAEHCRIKMENEKIIMEHRRIITEHQQLVLEHEEKANEHKLKAISYVLNKVT